MVNNKKQLSIGNDTEFKVGRFFNEFGYWAHILQKKQSGQPVDIVAIKGNDNDCLCDTWLIDAKHLRTGEKSFPFSRIEPNQIDSLTFAKNFAKIKNIGFVICHDDFEGKFFYLSFDKVLEIEKSGRKSAKISELEDLKCLLK